MTPSFAGSLIYSKKRTRYHLAREWQSFQRQWSSLVQTTTGTKEKVSERRSTLLLRWKCWKCQRDSERSTKAKRCTWCLQLWGLRPCMVKLTALCCQRESMECLRLAGKESSLCAVKELLGTWLIRKCSKSLESTPLKINCQVRSW